MDIFQYEFMQRALLAGVIVSVVAPMVGMFLVVKRFSMMADTLSHVSLSGVALGLLLGIHPIMGALGVAVISSVFIEQLRFGKKVFEESALALFLSGGLALAIVLLSFAGGINADLFSFLFGSITTVSPFDLMLIGLVGLASTATIVLVFKEMFVISLDEQLALSGGIPVRVLNILLAIVSALVIAVSLRIVGALLVSALMVIPVIAAMQYGLGFVKTLLVAISISFLAVIVGLVSSFYFDIPSGGSIVLIAILFFVVSYVWNSRS